MAYVTEVTVTFAAVKQSSVTVLGQQQRRHDPTNLTANFIGLTWGYLVSSDESVVTIV